MTLAPVATENLGLIALAVVLEAATSLAATALCVFSLNFDGISASRTTSSRTSTTSSSTPRCLANLGVKGVWISIQTEANGLLSGFLIRKVIAATDAVAVVAKLAVCKAIAVQLEALRAGAVARLTAGFFGEGCGRASGGGVF